jgi:hypothetical protein
MDEETEVNEFEMFNDEAFKVAENNNWSEVNDS